MKMSESEITGWCFALLLAFLIVGYTIIQIDDAITRRREKRKAENKRKLLGIKQSGTQ